MFEIDSVKFSHLAVSAMSAKEPLSKENIELKVEPLLVPPVASPPAAAAPKDSNNVW